MSCYINKFADMTVIYEKKEREFMDHHHNISPAQLQVLSLDKCVMILSTETGLILFSFCCMSKLIRS